MNLRLFAVVPLLLMQGCQTVLHVSRWPLRPVEFNWRADTTVKSLVVLADPDCPLLHDSTYQDRVWWKISGNIKPPVYYGQVPKGAVQEAAPRPLSNRCSDWVVSISDQSLRAESTTF